MVEQAVNKIFGSKRGLITAPFLRWLVRVPNLAESKSAVADAARLTQAAGFALLLGLVTFSVFHYYAVGLTSQGSSSLLVDAVTRSAGAALIILAWPWIFENGVALTAALREAFMPGPEMDKFLLELLDAAGIAGILFGGPGLVVGIVLALALALLSLALYVTKLGLTVGMLIAYVSMPLAMGLWAVPPLASPASYAARFCAAAATTQVVWALCIKLIAALNDDSVLGIGGGGPWTDTITMPLYLVAMMAAMLAVPRHVFQAWGLTSSGGNFIVGAASYMASQWAMGAVGRRMVKLRRIGQISSPARRAISSLRGNGQPPPPGPTPPAPPPNNSDGTDRTPPGGRTEMPPNGRRTARGHDELPTGAKERDVQSVLRRLGDKRTYDQAAVRRALDNVSKAGFARPALAILGDGGSHPARDAAIRDSFAKASVGDGVGPGLGKAFEDLFTAAPETRAAALANWRPPAPDGPPVAEPPRATS